MKALFIANLDSFHNSFHIPYIKRLNSKGYDVDLVSTGNVNFDGIAKRYNIVFGRSPLKMKNITAFRQLRKLLNTYYDLIYLSTPVVGAVGRLALIGKKHGRVVYSAHGYSFYKGNSKLSNLKYILVEKMLCKLTDCIFTMNEEDYEACKKYHFHCKEIYDVDGVGIDTKAYSRASIEEKESLRKRYGYTDNQFLLIYPAELTDRKNQVVLFDILKGIIETRKDVKLLLPGRGVNDEKYKQYVKAQGLENYVDFLGFRNDVKDLLKVSDVLFASSLTEGLPVNVIEGLASGLPVVATSVRGHVDLIKDGYNGFLFDINDRERARQKICCLIEDKSLYATMADQAIQSSKKYDLEKVVPQYDRIWGVQ